MRLVIPYIGKLNVADARLVRLAEFMGCQCELLPLDQGVALSPKFIEQHIADKNACFVVNATAIREWLGSESFPSDLSSYLTSQFSFVLAHNLLPDPFTASTVSTLSAGALHSIDPVETSGQSYEISSAHPQLCGAFSGLTFGPVNATNDQVIAGSPNARPFRTHIAIGGQPFFASIPRERAEVFFMASAEMADLDASWGGKPVECFSQLIPPAMFLRYAFREECWRPNQRNATLIIDDPLLRKNYGSLKYDRVLGLMDEYNFHTSIAFIPHNYRRNSKSVTRMFRERPDRFSICFHGNDHTAAELATNDVGLLNSMLTIAEERMGVHQKKTGIPCDRVMVFPQGNFSVAAMTILRAHNFSAAVNSGPFPLEEQAGLTLAEMIEPAILNYGAFPLFVRRYVHEITPQNVAFNLFFGKPVLIVEHHDVFKDPECLLHLVSRVNALAPDVRWSSLRSAVENSYLSRWAPDGTFQVRAYSNSGKIENSSDASLRSLVTWSRSTKSIVHEVFVDGIPWPASLDESGIGFCLELAPRSSRAFSLVHQNDFGLSDANRSFQWKAKAFLRRRLSEIRDSI